MSQNELYDSATAAHYAAYRPPLHARILAEYLPAGSQYGQGLDVGCGTGQSAHALAAYCRQVLAVDTSADMIARARPHTRITYQCAPASTSHLPARSFDLISLAGVWFYIRSQAQLDELSRLCRPGALLLLYDFAVELQPLLAKLKLELPPEESEYDHQANFSGLNTGPIQQLHSSQRQLSFELSAAQLAHLLLSLKSVFQAFAGRFGTPGPFEPLQALLKQQLGQQVELQARTYLQVYRYGS